MIISKSEKQYLQVYYIERIRKCASDMEDAVYKGGDEKMADSATMLSKDAKRVLELEQEYAHDLGREGVTYKVSTTELGLE